MATNFEDQKPRIDAPLVVDPAAEKQVKPVSSGTTTPRGPTGVDEQKFYEAAGDEFKLKQHQQDLGWLGKFFGSSGAAPAAPTNIAGLVAVFCIFALVISFLIPANTGSVDAQRLADGQKLLMGLIGSALSFIFGAATKK